MVKAAHNRFLAVHPVSTRDLLTPPAKIIDPAFVTIIFFHSVLFIGKSPKPFCLVGFIHFVVTSNAKANLMFQTSNIIAIDPMKTSIRFIGRSKQVFHNFF